jgi:hypothetical protein
MTTTPANEESSTDTDQYDADAAATIAADRLADELDPARFGQADELADALAAVAADLRAGEVTLPRLYDACAHVEKVQAALRDVSRLHGYGWEQRDGAHVTGQPEPDREAADE